MYQKKPREIFRLEDWRTKEITYVSPTWKIHSGLYQSKRPEQLYFPRCTEQLDSCELHNNIPGFPDIRVNDHGLSCPCRSTGNVDITTILGFLCRQLGYRGWAGGELPKPLWHKSKFGCNYGAFLESTMQTDRLHEIFQYLKNAPSRAYQAFMSTATADLACTIKQYKDDWYQSLGPGMETDGDKMGYNIGDVAGVALLMRFLTTTDDRML